MTREGNILKSPREPMSFSRIAPEIDELAEVDFVPLLNKDSTNMTPSDWTAMATTINGLMAPEHGYRGFVVAHGTDTIHFSASALAFAFGPNLNRPVVFTGAQTDASIHSTLHGALVRGYDASLVSDAHTTEDQSAWGAPPPGQVIAHTNLYWKYQTAPGRTAGTVETANVEF